MKARVVSQPEKVLCYGIPEKSSAMQSVRTILEKMRIDLRIISDEETGETVGYLAGLPGFTPSNRAPQPAAGECLIMSGLTRQRMDELLQSLRACEVRIPLKAVVTAHNQRWTFGDLMEELEKERQAVSVRR